MREIIEIQKDIDSLKPEFDNIVGKMSTLKNELLERKFFDFCNDYGVKAGDVVEVEGYKPFQIVNLHPIVNDWVNVRNFDDDGVLKPWTCTISQKEFYGCKVIGHKDLDDLD